MKKENQFSVYLDLRNKLVPVLVSIEELVMFLNLFGYFEDETLSDREINAV